MFTLGKLEPVVLVLIPERGKEPPVTATFNAQPSPLSLRAARRAVSEVFRDGEPRAEERAGDAFTAALVRHNLLGWTGLIGSHDEIVLPTHDREVRNEDGSIERVVPGTISAFIAEPRLMEAADREYVLPWSRLDAEKNGYAPLPAGISAVETPADDTATKPATPSEPADATSAHTKSTPRKRTKARRSGE